MNGSIYKITNLINKKRYIGQTIQEPAHNRWNKHCYMARKGHTFPLYSAMRKYDVENFEFELIQTGIQSIDELNIAEEFHIKHFNTTNKIFGYNLSSKALGKGKLSESTKEKIRVARSKQIFSEESRKRMSESHMGRKGTYGFTGKTHSQEYKDMMKNLFTNRIFSAETKEKMSTSRLKYIKQQKENI